MSWGSGGKHYDEILHAFRVRDAEHHAATARSAALTVAGYLGPDCRETLQMLGLLDYDGHDQKTTKGQWRPAPRPGALTTCWRCGQPRSPKRRRSTGLCLDCYQLTTAGKESA